MSHNLQRLTSFLTGTAMWTEPSSRQALHEWVAETLPTVSMAGAIANAWLCHHMAGLDEVVLLDIGPGTGRQAVDLVRRLGAREDRPRRLTVVAVEPDAVCLRSAEHNLLEAAQVYGLEVHVMAFHALVEELDPSFWALVASLRGTLLVHSAFALHLVRGKSSGEEARDAVLRRLRMLEPKALVLVEPSSDHSVADADQRFHNGWRHYGRLSQLVDRLALPQEHTETLKAFLARDLRDLLCDCADLSSLHHEQVSGWWRRLARAGFRRDDVPDSLETGSHPWVHPLRQPGYVGLQYDGETLVAVLCATPAARGSHSP
ncbi:GRAS family protein [Pyxidicoccus trucidator]|uniref:GRAS family protein n=1 Tax=Pyxidicoccus trucidator TaxID=2709662 RepID=UPI0013DB37FC|nr:GRAS family protein [Pyxidicoccus trucidator]